jgi:hypothetical protein
MCKHEQKNWPRCGEGFECKVGDVTNCQCYGIELRVEEAFITKQFADCLCRNCLLQLKSRYTLFVEQKDLYSNR